MKFTSLAIVVLKGESYLFKVTRILLKLITKLAVYPTTIWTSVKVTNTKLSTLLLNPGTSHTVTSQ